MSHIHRFEHPIIDEVAALAAPHNDELVINHSAALAIWGVDLGREPNDIDMTASLENIQHFRRVLGWEVVRRTVGHSHRDGTPIEIIVTRDPAERFDVYRWDFSRVRYEATGRGRVYLDEQQANSYQDAETGIYIATPEYVLDTKLQTGRPKDVADIERIEQYLNS